MRKKTLFMMSVVSIVFTGTSLAQDLPVSAQDIHKAVSDGNLTAVKEIVEAHPEAVNSTNDNGNTPVHIAALNGNVDILQYLLTKGADVNKKNGQSMSPLFYASYGKKTDAARFLVQHGADVNAQPSALVLAAGNGDEVLVETFLTAGADVNVIGMGGTPLQRACFNGHVKVAEILLHHGADPNKPGPGGRTALMMAALRGRTEPVRLLLENGADPNLKDTQSGGTALYAALYAGGDGGSGVAKMLISHGADIKVRTVDGDAPILIASRKGLTEVAALLLEKGANVNSVDEHYRRSLLHLAAIRGYRDLAELFLSQGADITAKDIYNRTALHYAVKHGNRTVADLLLAKGADPKEAKKAEAFSRRLRDPLKENEAAIWYLHTRGWAIKTRDHLFVFDNEEAGRPPDAPSLANGYITCPEIKDVSTYAIYTCYHAEPNTLEFIHAFEDSMKDITYIHFQGDRWRGNKNTVYMDGEQIERFGDVQILSARMDEDAWTLQYLIKDASVTFFYPGFLHRGLENLKKEVDHFAEHCEGVDFAFLYIPEGDPETADPYTEYVIEKLKPKVVFPMDPNRREPLYVETAKRLKQKDPKLQTGCAGNPGDRFFYSKGRLK
jgi:ankyrin repeat protein